MKNIGRYHYDIVSWTLIATAIHTELGPVALYPLFVLLMMFCDGDEITIVMMTWQRRKDMVYCVVAAVGVFGR